MTSLSSRSPRWYADQIVDWVMRQIAKCPTDWQDLILVTVATQLYSMRKSVR